MLEYNAVQVMFILPKHHCLYNPSFLNYQSLKLLLRMIFGWVTYRKSIVKVSNTSATLLYCFLALENNIFSALFMPVYKTALYIAICQLLLAIQG